MYCTNCGKQVESTGDFCTHCGQALFSKEQKEAALYHLPITEQRLCDIQVFSDRIIFSGKFWYLRDKDFYSNHGKEETAFIKDFLGIGYLTKRSYRKTVLFVFAGTFLGLTKSLVDKIGEWIENANSVLRWMDYSLSLPVWMNTTINILAVGCIIIGLMLFFSKKKVVEISFTTKRICIPQKSLSGDEFYGLHDIIKSLKG